ncbi:leucine-rich repeat-containing protein 15-like [Zophobas morio]|uniref:leucine-rich repeat-containing protein 15-like n=1 Tax=Zophobas morio TaxID=2755281 RepID=UPI003082EBA8
MHKILWFLSVTYFLATSATETTFEKNGITFKKDEDGDYVLSTHEILALQPGSIADVEDMETLYLIDEDFTDIQPRTFQNLPNLKKLIITMNKIPKIKTGVFNCLTNLTRLDLSANRISHVDSNAFDNMTSLQNINLSDNRFTSVDTHWFLLTPSLTMINLGYNELTEIPGNIFSNVKSTVPSILLFDGNHIAKVDKDAFKGLKIVSTLSLDFNKLKTLNGDFLRGLEIDVLSLKNNTIECVDEKYFAAVFVANSTDISDNHWTATCLTAIETWAKEHNKVVKCDS